MSERPKVKRTADKIAEAILGKSIMDLRSKTIKDDVKQKIIGSKVLTADTCGKNILISFSRNVYLCNHMMMCTCVSGSVVPVPIIVLKRDSQIDYHNPALKVFTIRYHVYVSTPGIRVRCGCNQFLPVCQIRVKKKCSNCISK